MHVTADAGRCRGYGSCMLEAPEVFDLDEDENKVILLQESPPESLHTKTDRAIRSCPAKALGTRDE
ncbi:ferredoxin [Rhodococcus sp. ACS1]|uniref:Ferredoxin n=2 Tax=Rhodococcus TaxID=1827 RepID=A0A1H4SN75_9NOCA|nr:MULTISPECIES: ferredoxin [Rhodococcus]PBC46512.1 ferredoxin [Rhodococcus sp. ACS1]QSE82480.1 ferredoxin [Rhodococcus koreensis]QYB02244.1 ferredoxin [Rhodococcus sp. USK10]SEC45281.1 Ferredoxin [Rhodococcus koreensis]